MTSFSLLVLHCHFITTNLKLHDKSINVLEGCIYFYDSSSTPHLTSELDLISFF